MFPVVTQLRVFAKINSFVWLEPRILSEESVFMFTY